MPAPRRSRAAPFDYELARRVLEETLESVEQPFTARERPPIDDEIDSNIAVLFESQTQAYRETLVGSALVRIIDRTRNLRQPYVNQGASAYNARTLDERVVNPFLHDHTVPCSTGPFLSAFRRNIQFTEETARGLRDRDGYTAFLAVITVLETASEDQARSILAALLYRFLDLRDSANIALTRVRRLSVEQHAILIDALLRTPSGGLLPVLLAVAMFNALNERFALGWDITSQGINVADRASGVGGDITIRRGSAVVLAVEVTERPIDRSRVVSTFNTKISPHGIEDYLFFSTGTAPDADALAVAKQYFAQGHEITFLDVKPWLVNCLGTVGPNGRTLFTEKLLDLLAGTDVPAAIKLAWNTEVQALLART